MLDSMITTEITLTIFLLCSAASVLLGIAAAFVMTRGAHSTQSFCITIAVLPLAVQTVIMLANGQSWSGRCRCRRVRACEISLRAGLHAWTASRRCAGCENAETRHLL